MPQCFQVLRCYKCFVFQVHQVKKSNKFECKLCCEKQSIKRHYGIGSGKECRLHVQKLNSIKGNMDELNDSLPTDDEDLVEQRSTAVKDNSVNVNKESKWSEYIEMPHVDTSVQTGDDAEVVLEIPRKRRKFVRNTRNKSNSYKRKGMVETSTDNSLEDPSKNHEPIDTSAIITESEAKPSTSKQTMLKQFIPPTCNKHSKWVQYTDEINQSPEDFPCIDEDTDSCRDKENGVVSKDNKLNLLPNETIKNNSKWDSYTNTKKSSKKFLPPNPVSISANQKLFSLCNDNDLDNILDI